MHPVAWRGAYIVLILDRGKSDETEAEETPARRHLVERQELVNHAGMQLKMACRLCGTAAVLFLVRLTHVAAHSYCI